MKLLYRRVVRVSCAGSGSTTVVVSSSATGVPRGSDQSATNSVDHCLETVVGAELLIHVI